MALAKRVLDLIAHHRRLRLASWLADQEIPEEAVGPSALHPPGTEFHRPSRKLSDCLPWPQRPREPSSSISPTFRRLHYYLPAAIGLSSISRPESGFGASCAYWCRTDL
jgi:hypothetical protein